MPRVGLRAHAKYCELRLKARWREVDLFSVPAWGLSNDSEGAEGGVPIERWNASFDGDA